MKLKLKGLDYIRAIIARWIVINIAFRISKLSVIHLCLEMSKIYNETIEVSENEE